MEKELAFEPYLVFEYYRDEPVCISLEGVQKANEKSLRKLIKHLNNLESVSFTNVRDFIDIKEDYYITNIGLKSCSVKAVPIEEAEVNIPEETVEEVKTETKPKKKTTKKGK